MSEINEEDAKSSVDDINIELFRYIETSDLEWRKKGTYSDLINSQDQENLKIKITSGGRRFDFKEPVYIDFIEFLSANDSTPEIVLSYYDLKGNKVLVDESMEERSKKWVDFRLHALVKGIEVAPKGVKSSLLGKLAGIYITGVSLGELPARLKGLSVASKEVEALYTKTVKDLDSIRKENESIISNTTKHKEYVDSVEASLAEKKAELVDINKELETLKKEAESKKDSLAKTSGEVAAQQAILSELETKQSNSEDSIEQLNEERNILNKEIAKGAAKLKELKDDINSYSENISDYVRESNRQASLYFVLTALALGALGVIGYQLVIRVNDLIDYYEKLNIAAGVVGLPEGAPAEDIGFSVSVPAFDLLLLRAPMALIVSFFIFLFSKVVYSLIKKIIGIQDEKKELIGASIIARETVEASSKDLDLSPAEVYELKEGLKLDFLQHTMFSGHVKSVRDAKDRRNALFSNAKLKIKERFTGTDVELSSQGCEDSTK
jgi:uncharacterized coiled-coil protein SlyX